MEKDEKLIVGIDICEDVTQIAYFDRKQLKPVSIMDEKEEEYLIPTKLSFRQDEAGLEIGKEGETDLSEGVLWIDDLFSRFQTEAVTEIFSKSYTSGELMEIFLKKIFALLYSCHSYKEIEFISLTFSKITKAMVSQLSIIMDNLGLKGRYTLLDHEEAFFYHTILQSKEKKGNDTALFELDEEEMTFKLLHIDYTSMPIMAKITERYLTEDVSRKLVREKTEEAVNVFENLALMALERRHVSDIYAVGRGFLTDWADGVLRKLAPGRHVFRGQNLFVKGACYFARERAVKREDEIIFMGEDRISAGVSIMAIKDGREREIMLASPSLKWYEADVITDVIIKGEDEISIQIKDFLSKKLTRKFLSLSGINLTGNDLTRIRINVRFKDKNTCVIKALDLGFGSFVPTTNRVWELTWEK